VTRVTLKECVVDVLAGTHVWEVTRAGGEAELLVLRHAAAAARGTGIARTGSLIRPSDAAFVAHSWVRQETLTREWTVGYPGVSTVLNNTGLAHD